MMNNDARKFIEDVAWVSCGEENERLKFIEGAHTAYAMGERDAWNQLKLIAVDYEMHARRRVNLERDWHSHGENVFKTPRWKELSVIGMLLLFIMLVTKIMLKL